jgi:hypothetical protein
MTSLLTRRRRTADKDGDPEKYFNKLVFGILVLVL